MNGPGARRDLHLEPFDGDPGQPAHQLVPQVRRAVHHRLGVVVVLGRAALDEVRREGERRSAEPDERGVPQLTDETADGLGDVGDVAGFEGPQPL